MKLIYRLMIGLALVVMNAGVTMAENQMATQIKSQIKASGLEEEIWNVIGLGIISDDHNYQMYEILSPS
ncbi:hypothetical protein N5853_03925 [Bartonella sp. HY329]|uniref:hypothetical protein n=1 Tax=unclassified Bartonella TaxID=2645622 RepID=UPI0021C7E408|nr:MULTISPECIES: hypothetical protein [unclassified Bartonella]UXM95784.1 hypothetical protein N5853_03925 [Bartonella sp. HY329]UXN10109.1 hypothetical protein N5852_03935 [Bartonella sp. HY328]